MAGEKITGWDQSTGLIIPNRDGVYARAADEQEEAQFPHVAVVTGWWDAPDLGIVNVQSHSYQPVLGVAYILWGLAARPLITDLVVAGNSINQYFSGAQALLALGQIKQSALGSSDYPATFLSLFSQSSELAELYSFLDSMGWVDTVGVILRDVNIHDCFSEAVKIEDVALLKNYVGKIRPKPPRELGFTVESLRMPEDDGREAPLPLPTAPISFSTTRADFPQTYLHILDYVIRFGKPRGPTKEVALEATFPYQDPEKITPEGLAAIGLDSGSLARYFSLMIPLDLLGRTGEIDPEDASYLYLACIFGVGAFPVSYMQMKEKGLSADKLPAMAWLADRFGGRMPENQFRTAVDSLVSDRFSRQAVIAVYQGEFHGRMKSPPCLTQIQLLSDPSKPESLNMFVTVRSHDIGKAYPSNVLALMKLLQVACEQVRDAGGVEFTPGKITISSHSAHVYNQDLVLVEPRLKNMKSRRFEWDPLGNVVDSFDPITGIFRAYIMNGAVQVVLFEGHIRSEDDVQRALRKIFSYPLTDSHKSYVASRLASRLVEYTLKNNPLES